MTAVVRRTLPAFVLVLVLLITGAWQSHQVAHAQSQPDVPLYPGVTWSSGDLSSQNIRINIQGDAISLSGARYEAREQFPTGLSQEVLDYYSNAELANSGWTSYDAFDGTDGVHFVFYHESGVYLSVEFLKCPQAPSSTCLAVWKSEPVPQTPILTPGTTPEVGELTTFGKTSPSNGATGLDPRNTTLSWQAYPNADKYSYCVKIDSECEKGAPEWTSSYSRSVTLTNLAFDKTYYWQVKATTCQFCIPKPWVYADNDTPWRFRTKTGTGTHVSIVGNAGVGGAVISYTDGTARSVTADGNGAYSLEVSYNWTGTITPSKPGYLFSPASASFTNLTAPVTIQNFTVIPVYVISGNTGVPGVTLSYVNGTPRTVVSDANGNYSIGVPAGWSGTVTPSRTAFVFSPPSRTYSNLASNQTAQNYAATIATFTITGNTGVGGVTLRYWSGAFRTVVSDSSGNYSITVPYGWGGRVTPSKTGFVFSPVDRTYVNVITNQTGQNYTAIPLHTISGNVGVAGATLSYTDGTPRSVISRTDGSYSLTVHGSWTGTVTPTHGCFTFSPVSRNYSGLTSDQTGQNYTPTVKAGCADVSVQVSGANQGRFGLPAKGSTRVTFTGLNNGPAKITSTNAISLIAGERVIYKAEGGVNTSFSEMIGLPNSQLDMTYWLPWYNNVDLETQLRFANVTNSTATVRLLIGGQEKTSGCTPSSSPYTLGAGASLRVSCAGVNAGPVEIRSTQNIVASERVILKVGDIHTSFSEMLALPARQLSNTYWLPLYNNVDLDTQLRFANVSTSPATVRLFIGGVEKTTGCTPNSPYILAARASLRVSCAGVNGGPVEIRSTQNIVASERVIFEANNLPASYSEMMAMPSTQLNTTYWFPWYNNVDVETQLRIANVSGQAATVRLYVGGVEQTTGCTSNSPFTVPAGWSVRVSCTGVNGGPLEVRSTQNIVASARVLFKAQNVYTSFSEVIGLPNSLLDPTYWFPWYNNLDLDTQLRFGRP